MTRSGGRPGVALLVLCAGAVAVRAEVTAKATVDAEIIGTQDYVQYSIVISSTDGSLEGITLEPPVFQGVAESQGPSTSQQTSMSFVGGTTQVVRTITYSWILMPETSRSGTKLVEGRIAIGPAVVKVGTLQLKTEPIDVKVTEGRLRQQSRARRRSPFDDPFFGGDPFEEMFGRPRQQERGHLELLAEIDRARVYVGEAITLTFRIRTNVQVGGLRMEKAPSLEGFRVEELKVPEGQEQEVEVVDGRQLVSAVVKRMALYPLQPGPQTVSASEWIAQAQARGLWSAPQPVPLQTKPLRVDVLPLPSEGRPEGFTGAVGKFTLDAKLDKAEVALDEPITLKVTLSGTGDLDGVTALPLPALPEFKVYDPKVTDGSSGKGPRSRNVRTFEYVLIPKAPGDQEVPAIGFPYFDPEAKAYAVARAAALPVRVTRPAGASGLDQAGIGESLPPVAAREVSILGHDIRYLKGLPDGPVRPPAPPWERRGFWLLVIVPVAANAALGLVSWRRRHRAINVGVYRARGAAARARQAVKRTRRSLARKDEKAFHAELADALTGFVADRFGVPAAGLTTFRIDTLLEESGCPAELRSELKALLQECDYARFTPAEAQGEEMRSRRDRALGLLGRMDRTLPRSRPKAPAAAAALVLALAGGPAHAAGSGEVRSAPDFRIAWEGATAAYAASRFDESAELWRQIRDGGGGHPSVHYNLGNALLKAGKVGPAIASYRRALRLAPGDPDIMANLAFAAERAVDEVARAPLRQDLLTVASSYVPASAAALAFAGLFAVGQLFLALAILMPGHRGLLAVAFSVLTLASLVSAGYALAVARHEASRVEAVVVVPKAEARSGPGEENAALFAVHEGLSALVRQEQGSWVLVTLPNDLTGWLPSASLELVRSPGVR